MVTGFGEVERHPVIGKVGLPFGVIAHYDQFFKERLAL
jgi:hypothetical protein